MGLARSIERRLEGLLEGFFGRVFRSRLQPLEIGRRIGREMEEGRTVSVNRVYAPNEFNIWLGPEDHARFASMEAGLQREFSDIVIDTAKRRRWNLMGIPRIHFHRSEDLGEGEFRVEASLAADARVPEQRASTHEPRDGDLSVTRAVSFNTAERLGLARAPAELVVLTEAGEEKERISLTNAPVTIGRLSMNDVVLADPNVSRRHAELRRENGRWRVVDLGSTNGTTVNGRPARDQVLKNEDRLSFGTSELVFRLPGLG